MKDKPLRVAVLCLLCLLLPALPVAAQDDGFMEIGKDGTGSTLWLHLPSVEVRRDEGHSYVAGWVRFIYSDARAAELAVNGVKPHHSMDFYAANPRARQIQTISTAYYDKEGRHFYSNSRYDGFRAYAWEECIPGTNGEAIWNALMMAAGYR